MTPQQIDAFLRKPYVSIIATLRQDGSPHLTPVWHQYDGETLKVLSPPNTVKVRNLRLDPRVALCVSTNNPPAGYVQVKGTATLSDDWEPRLLWAMAINYKGREEGERYAEKTYREVTFTLITITPTKLVAWSIDDE